MARILIGISSWADRTLLESGFYPEAVKSPAGRLRYYSEHFPVAEIDSSYHYLPTRSNLELWLNNVPKGFVFDLKAFSLLTQHPTPFSSLPKTIRDEFGSQIKAKGNVYLHHLPLEAVDSLWQGFIRTAETIRQAGKLGTALFQFPPWFHPDEKNFEYIAQVSRILAPYQMAVEFRFNAWLDDRNREKTKQFLLAHKITLVCVDEPQGFSTSLPPLAEVTAPLGFVRFHGRNRETWEQKGSAADEKFRYLYEENELKEWLPRVRDMAHKTDELHIIFKNKYRDYPVKNAREFGRLLGSETGSLEI